MKCWYCGKYTFDEHNLCVPCAEENPRRGCTTENCKELHV